MKKVLLILVLVLSLGAANSHAIWPFGGLKSLMGTLYKKTETQLSLQDLSLAKIQGNQIELNNNMSAILNIQNTMSANLTNLMDIMVSFEANITNEMKASLSAIASAQLEVKGMIGSVDNSMKQQQSVGSGTLTSITGDPKFMMIVALGELVVIIIFICAFVYLMNQSMKHEANAKTNEAKAKDYKRSMYDNKLQLDKITTALAKNPEITMDFNGSLHNGDKH